MNLPEWKDRPVLIANLLNPAFCGEIIRISILSFEKESKKTFPFALAFLILPFILHEKTRKLFPKMTSFKFYEWLEEQTQIRVGLQDRIKSMVPFTREALSFMLYYETLKISNNGELTVLANKKKPKADINDDEIKDILTRAEFFGKWLSKMGSYSTVFAVIGVEP